MARPSVRTNLTPFAWLDVIRRAEGDALQAIGFGLDEHDYHMAASGLRWRPRDHGSPAGRPFVLIVAATIKRPYIRDLSAAVSAIRIF